MQANDLSSILGLTNDNWITFLRSGVFFRDMEFVKRLVDNELFNESLILFLQSLDNKEISKEYLVTTTDGLAISELSFNGEGEVLDAKLIVVNSGFKKLFSMQDSPNSFENWPAKLKKIRQALLCHYQSVYEAGKMQSGEVVGKEGSRDLKVSSYYLKDNYIISCFETCSEHIQVAKQHKLISFIAQSLLSLSGLEQKVELCLKLICEFVDGSNSYVCCFKEYRSYFSGLYKRSAADSDEPADILSEESDSFVKMLLSVFQAQGEIYTRDVNLLSQTIAAPFKKRGVKALFMTPLLVRDQVIGFIVVENKELNYKWQEITIEFFLTLKGMLSSAFERELIEKELQFRNDELQLVFNNSPLIHLLINEQSEIVRINSPKRLNSLYDKAEGLLPGHFINCSQVSKKHFSCGDSPVCVDCILKNTFKKTLNLQKGLVNQTGCLKVMNSNNEDEKYLNISTSYISDKTGNSFVLMSIQDITNEKKQAVLVKESEEKYRFLVDNISDYIWRTDSEFKYTYISPSVKQIRGFNPEELIGESVFKTISAESYFTISKLFQQKLKQIRLGEHKGWESETLDIKYLDKHKNTFWGQVTARLLPGKNNEIEGVIGVTRDMSDKKKYELELAQLNNQLKNELSEKDGFISILGHDLNGMIGASVQMVELIQHQEIDESLKAEATRNLLNNVQSTHHLVTDLINWGKASLGQIDFVPVQINLCHQFHKVKNLYKAQAEFKSINIKMFCNDGQLLVGDESMINAILRNLVKNALKYTQSMGCITLSHHQDKESHQLSVADTGVGMKSEIIQQIVAGEYRPSKTNNVYEKGFGLGFQIIKKYVSLHGGTMAIESVIGRGTKVIISIPQKGISIK